MEAGGYMGTLPLNFVVNLKLFFKKKVFREKKRPPLLKKTCFFPKPLPSFFKMTTG